VLHSRSVEYAGRHRVLLRVLSTFRPDAGTLMTYEEDPMQLPLISGIACQHGLTFLQLQALSHTDFCRLLNLLAERNVETDMLQQYGVWPDQLTVQLVLTNSDWLQVADDVQNLLKNCRDAQHRIQANLAKLSVVGIGVRSQPDVVARIHQLLNQLNIQIWAMTQTESRFSVLMAPELVECAAAKLHQVLFNSDN
jgi:aspartate kinase